MAKKTKEQIEKYLQKEICKAEKLGIKLYDISPDVRISKSKSTFGTCKRVMKDGKTTCYVSISSFTRGFKKKEIKAILMHEILHATIGSNGHDKLWRKGCILVKEKYSYDKYEKYHLNEHPYSKKRAKLARYSGLCR